MATQFVNAQEEEMIEEKPKPPKTTIEDVNKIENEIAIAERDIENYDRLIEQQHIDIKEYKRIMIEKRDIYQDTKRNAGSSWEAIQNVEKRDREYDDAIKDYNDARKHLPFLLTMKSNLIKELKQLESDLSDTKEQLRITEFNENSKLTKLIGVQISNSCKTMIINGFNTTCPNYEDLIKYDNSNTEVSGEFVTDSNGFFHRAEPDYEKSWRWYDYDDELRVIVDPPNGMLSKIKMITINPNLDTYQVTGDRTQHAEYEIVDGELYLTYGNTTQIKQIEIREETQSFARILYHDRYVDSCRTAEINSSKWEMLLTDTIDYLRNHCQEKGFEEREIIEHRKTEIPIMDSPNYQYFQWIEQVKQNCIFKYNAC